MVRSRLEYGSIIWDPFKTKQIDELEMVQRRAARFVCRDYKRTSSVTSMMKELGWDNLVSRRKASRLKMLNRIVKDETGLKKEEYLTSGPAKTRTKNDNKLSVYRAVTNEFKYSFFPRTIVEWNNTPQSEINTISISDSQRHQ